MTTPYRVRCPECGKMHKRKMLFVRPGEQKTAENVHCACSSKSHTIGYDNSVAAILENGLIMAEMTCSGVNNDWLQNSLRCPICNTFQSEVHPGDMGQNIPCVDPSCPTIGYDYDRQPEQMFVTASGVSSDVIQFLMGRYERSGLVTNKPIDRFLAGDTMVP